MQLFLPGRASSGEEDEDVPDPDDLDVPSLVGKTIVMQEGDDEATTWVFMEDNEGFVSGGEAGDGVEFYYEQEGAEVWIEVVIYEFEAIYDGESLHIVEDEGPGYPGFYNVEMPSERPCDHAYVIKIERHHHPVLD